ncbi:MAG: hypothetical protein ACSHXK_13690 [Oceanococcus sp.]
MLPIDERVITAQQLWKEALDAEASGRYARAYELHTQAHDLVLDCAKMHQQAHQHLRRVNKILGNYTELVTDSVLLFLAPVGIFELIAYFSKTDSVGHGICKRKA